MESFTEQSNITTSGRSDSSVVGSLQKCSEFHTNGGYSYPLEVDAHMTCDEACTEDDPTQTVRPKTVCITELCDQQPSTTTSTFTEDLQVEADQRSLNLPPLSLCPNDEKSSFISLDSDSIASSEINAPLIFIPSVLDKLKEFEEVSSEIRNADPKYGKHLPPLPLCLASDPEIEHMPPITLNTEDSNCMASDHLASNMQLLTTMDNKLSSGGDCEPEIEHMPPITLNTEDSNCMASDHLANNMQLLTTMDNKLSSGGDCEPKIEHMPPITLNTEDCDCMVSDHLANNMRLLTTMDNKLSSGGDCEPHFQIKRPILSEKIRICDILCSDITAENSECFLEQNSPSTQHVVEKTQLQPFASSAFEISKQKVQSAVTEQLDVHVTPVRNQLLDALADDNDLFPVEVAESTTIISIAVTKNDGNGVEPATNTIQVKSVAADKPRQGRRRSFLSTLGSRLLKFGRTLCCCCK